MGKAMISLSVKSNIKSFTRGLDKIQKKELPTAIRNALSDTAFDVRKRIVNRTFPRSFNLRNKRFASQAMRVKKATKTNLVASVFDPKRREWLARHVTGGIKKPRGRNLAIPVGIKRLASGKIGKAKRPRALLNKPKTFAVKNDKGRLHAGIYQRRGKKQYPIKLLYIFSSSAAIRRRFPFYEDANSTATRSFPNKFRRELSFALRRAR